MKNKKGSFKDIVYESDGSTHVDRWFYEDLLN